MPRTKGDGPNKMGLVREALKVLGDDAKPKAIQEHIMTNSQVEIAAQMISSYKSVIAKKAGMTGKKRGRKPKSETVMTSGAVAAVRPFPGRSGGDVSFTDIHEVKELLRRHGAKKLSDLITALA
jgi:hypothetical protein